MTSLLVLFFSENSASVKASPSKPPRTTTLQNGDYSKIDQTEPKTNDEKSDND